MTLLEELRTQDRDYWLTLVSPDGTSRHPDLKIMTVEKGANSPEVEGYLQAKELEMIAILEGQ